MCGRYYIAEDYLPQWAADGADGFKPSFPDGTHTDIDIHPGACAPVVSRAEAPRTLAMRWGFAGVNGGLIINARIETMYQKPTFARIAARQRCAMPASGYYEWRRSDRQKYRISLHEAGLFYLAGLFRLGENGPEYVVMTQPPTSRIAAIHSRMPVILPDRAAAARWLDGDDGRFDQDERLIVRASGDEQLRMTF